MTSILFLGKREDAHCRLALSYCREWAEVEAHLGGWGDPLPEAVRDWDGDIILSYLSRWVVPDWLLDRAQTAINFHPAPPEYPGIGCVNFALYEEAEEYGVTCHHMASVVDTGAIIAVRRFAINEDDSVASVLARTYDEQFLLFSEVLSQLRSGEPLPVTAERWGRPPIRRTEFERLFEIDPQMPEEEVSRRVRATTYKHWGPRVRLGKYVFHYAGAEGFGENA